MIRPSFFTRAIIAPIIGLYSVGCMHSNQASAVCDLGSVEPGQTLNPTLEISNPYEAPAELTGLDGSCGVQVVDAHNRILGPHESMMLRLVAHAPLLPGPGAFKLQLGFHAANQEQTSFHVFAFTVNAHPFISQQRLWLDKGTTCIIHVYEVPPDAIVSLDCPVWAKGVVSGHDVVFSGALPSDVAEGRGEATVRSGDIVVARFPLELCRKLRCSEPRIYPSIAWLADRRTTLSAVNAPRGSHLTVNPPGSVTARLVGSDISIERTPTCKRDEATVALVSHHGQMLASCKIWLGTLGAR